MKDNFIYRVRPISNNAIDELKNSYLWFSRPEKFTGDSKEANISAFFHDTKAIEKGFLRARPDYPYDKWFSTLRHTGICCFTRTLPTLTKVKIFPGCKKNPAICIAYDKTGLEDFFKNHPKYPMFPCFHKVIYARNPTKIDSCDEWSILWDSKSEYKVYRTIPGILHDHPREFDKLLFKLFSRITSKYKRQLEERIILGGDLIPNHDSDTKGYKISIPHKMIRKIYVYQDVPPSWIKQLTDIDNIKDQIVILQ